MTYYKDRAEVIEAAKNLDLRNFLAESSYKGPGRLEGNTDRPLAAALSIISLQGCADALAGSTEYGLRGARVGRFVLWTNDQGFQTVETFDSETIAQAALDAEGERQNPEGGDDE